MFKNARIVAINPNPAEYRSQKVEDRGKPDYVVSSSDLRLILSTSPSKWFRGFTLPDSDSLEYGSLFDMLVLTPDDFDKRYIIQPETYQSEGMECPQCKSVTEAKKCKNCGIDRVKVMIEKPWSNQSTTCTDWTEAQAKAGREVIDQKMLDRAMLAKKRMLIDPEISQLLENSDHQVWVEAEWHDALTGIVVKVRCLIDFACKEKTPFEKIIGDLKSSKDARVTDWARWARKAGYDMQGAWNLDLFNAATNRGAVNFAFVLSESSAPFEIGRRLMEEDPFQPEQNDFTPGRSKYRRAMTLYCQCLKSGRWPGYDDTDISSKSGWTKLSPDPFDEQRRMFEPQFQVKNEAGEPVETAKEQEPDPDLIP